jgi:hypothetical protein
MTVWMLLFAALRVLLGLLGVHVIPTTVVVCLSAKLQVILAYETSAAVDGELLCAPSLAATSLCSLQAHAY